MLLVIRKYSEAAAMVGWGIRIAEALGSPLNILWLEHGGEAKQASDLDWKSWGCLLYTSPSPRDATLSRMPSSA